LIIRQVSRRDCIKRRIRAQLDDGLDYRDISIYYRDMISLIPRGDRAGRRPPEPASVIGIDVVTPGVRRLTLGGEAVRERLAAGPIAAASWLKVFAPESNGRAYTIREHDPVAGTIAIDFVLHAESGERSVATWARHARAGDTVHIGGLRNGEFALLADSRWIRIAVDPSALPAAQTILKTLPAHVTAYVTVNVSDLNERQSLHAAGPLEQTWLYGTDVPPAPATALMSSAAGQAWIAGESGWAKQTKARTLLSGTLDEARIVAKGYWKIGESGHREHSRQGHRR
jgi:NADPH-dependent ferric siderophore reductase